MNSKLKNTIALSLLLQIGLVLWIRGHPGFIESWYSQGLYPLISHFFRTLYGWVPFSVGDCLYALLGVLASWYVIGNRLTIYRQPLVFLRDVFMVLSVAYFSFNLLWGLNYYRQPLRTSLDLQETYTKTELLLLTERLIRTTNAMQVAITSDSLVPVAIPYSRSEILAKTLDGYSLLIASYPQLNYEIPSVKTSLFSSALTYMGYGGYLNPFTNEAQVNGKIPLFRFPVICGHEIGHQLGYSAENETNFIGYLVTAGNEDRYFRYSAYAYAASYCLAEIRLKDPSLSKRLYGTFNPGVQANFKELEAFWKRYENPMEPVFKSVFNTFLKANNQAEGLRSYNRIVSLLVAYHRKHPI